MPKHCAVCGRLSPVGAMQCAASRSREFGESNPTKDYVALQKAERLAEKATALAQASESLGSHPTWLMWPSMGVGAALFGAALLFQGTIGTILVIAGAVALVYSRYLSFVSSTQIHIGRQLERSRRSP